MKHIEGKEVGLVVGGYAKDYYEDVLEPLVLRRLACEHKNTCFKIVNNHITSIVICTDCGKDVG
jgi:hypothetical protein